MLTEQTKVSAGAYCQYFAKHLNPQYSAKHLQQLIRDVLHFQHLSNTAIAEGGGGLTLTMIFGGFAQQSFANAKILKHKLKTTNSLPKTCSGF